jgi:hypothetical protein
VSGRGPGRGSHPFARRRGRTLPGDGPLARVPAVVVFVVVIAVFLAAVLMGGVLGALLLGLLAVGVTGLLAATWTRLSFGERVLRVLVLTVLVAVAVGLAVR